jgi:mannose-6-phosphate isomerase-like protein (cupin superfamily)
MKIVKLAKTEKFKNNDFCTGLEYPANDKDINISVIKLAGRYPEEGKAYNEICKECAYILKGSPKLHINDQIIELNKGDFVIIEPKEKYYWEGDFTMLVPCTPAWTPEQHRIDN